jgi:hypothetical protein
MYIKIADNSWEIKVQKQAEELLQFISTNENEALSSTGISRVMEEADYPVFRRDKMTQTLDFLFKNKQINRKREKNYFIYWKNNNWEEVE